MASAVLLLLLLLCDELVLWRDKEREGGDKERVAIDLASLIEKL